MDIQLPSTRELELEMLLREREGQVVQLSDEVSRLRLYLSSQPPPSTAEPVTLPPTFASLLLPHIPHLPQASAPAGSLNNNTTTAALTQRVKVLQEENDELYDILKKSETGRLKEEVQSLKRIVDKLEGALRESHQVIITLSTELDKSYHAFASTSAPRNASPQNHFNNHHNNNNGVKPYPRSHSNSTGGGRLPPTGPRAHTHTHTHTHKKQRLSQADQDETSPSMRSNVSLPSGNGGRRGRSRSKSRSPRGKSSVKMEVDEVQEGQQQQQQQPRRSPERNRERWDRDRERGDRDRGRDRDRDGNRSRRNGGGGRGGSRRGGGGGGDRVSHSLYNPSSNFAVDQGNSGGNGADRSLAERMGLS